MEPRLQTWSHLSVYIPVPVPVWPGPKAQVGDRRKTKNIPLKLCTRADFGDGELTKLLRSVPEISILVLLPASGIPLGSLQQGRGVPKTDSWPSQRWPCYQQKPQDSHLNLQEIISNGTRNSHESPSEKVPPKQLKCQSCYLPNDNPSWNHILAQLVSQNDSSIS